MFALSSNPTKGSGHFYFAHHITKFRSYHQKRRRLKRNFKTNKQKNRQKYVPRGAPKRKLFTTSCFGSKETYLSGNIPDRDIRPARGANNSNLKKKLDTI